MANVLVVVASRHGGTAEIGDWIGGVLRERGHVVSVEAPGPEVDPSGADAVVLGSAIYARRWLDDARAWVGEFHDVLAARPVWLFESGMGGGAATDDAPSGDAARVAQLGGMQGFRHFGGRLDRSLLSRSERAVIGALRSPDADARVRPDIESWAADIGREIDAAALQALRLAGG